MVGFNHHTYFPKERDIQRYLFPFVCFKCRKSFRKPHSLDVRLCPQCSTPMTMLGRKFHAPKKTEAMQWKKIQLLAAHGFLFQSIYIPSPAGGSQVVPYPRTLKEAITFVATYRDQAFHPWRIPRTAALGYIK
uniref:hypothetical protein n=1 Tax=Methylomonas sp. PHL2-19 TaxID=3438878 RepID=UPI00402B6970